MVKFPVQDIFRFSGCPFWGGSFFFVATEMLPGQTTGMCICGTSSRYCGPDLRVMCWTLVTRQPTWVFPKIWVPQNGWFIMEKSLKWMIWGYPYFWKHPHKPTIDQSNQAMFLRKQSTFRTCFHITRPPWVTHCFSSFFRGYNPYVWGLKP